MLRLATTLLAASLFAGPVAADAVKYNVDKSHANLSFSYNHLGYSTTDGRFGDWDADLMIDADDPAASSVSFTIQTNSLDTFWTKRDEHLKSADFFEAATFPEITFVSTAVEKTGEKTLKVTGDLTIKGITKPAVLDVNVLAMGDHPMAKKPAAGFEVSSVIKRSDYGMDKFVPYVSDEVAVKFFAETLKAE